MSDQKTEQSSVLFNAVVAIRDRVILVHTIASFVLAFALLILSMACSIDSARVLRIVIVVGTLAELLYATKR